MLRIIVSLLFVTFASPLSAQSCPKFFRFVDFGLKANDGVVYRGGPIFRAESLEGQPLLLRERTQCRTVPEIAKDGHGNPIPVVTDVFYNPERTGFALDELRLGTSERTADIAEDSAATHKMALAKSGAVTAQGTDFLCASLPGEISCQLRSPYGGTIPLIVTCTMGKCTMPVLAITDQIFASSDWAIEDVILKDPETAGLAISKKIQSIHAFFEPLSSTS